MQPKLPQLHSFLAKTTIACCVAMSACIDSEPAYEGEDYTQYVNPLIGTTGAHPTAYGGTLPSVAMPFGTTHWSIMTRQNKISSTSYHYDDSVIVGFIGTHQPAVWMGDYGQISFMPMTMRPRWSLEERAVRMQHQVETAKPHYGEYIWIEDENELPISTKFTPTRHGAFFVINFIEKYLPAYMILDISTSEPGDGYVKIIPEKNRIVGYNADRHSAHLSSLKLPNFKGYFVMEFDSPINDYAVNIAGDVKDTSEATGNELQAMVGFGVIDKALRVKIATSFISIEQAEENLKNELGNKNYDDLYVENKATWNRMLSRVQAVGGTEDEKTIFYTALYRTLLLPRSLTENGKYYSAFDDKVHEGETYTDFSLWDTYRAQHPLLTLIAPEKVNPMMQSLVNAYNEGGWLPKWPNPSYTNIMIGTHADAVLADAYLKGFTGFDAQKAYEGMYKNAMTPPEGDDTCRWRDRLPNAAFEARGGLSRYKELGYVPLDKYEESVSRTIEFSYDDYCVAQMAKALGKNEDYTFFMNRSKNYKNLYNAAAGRFMPKLSNGEWSYNDTAVVYHEHRKAYRSRGFTEGAPQVYLFGAKHDLDGMAELMGGKNEFEKALDAVFENGFYAHDNEPAHHYIYLYSYLNKPEKTRKMLAKHIPLNYANANDGLSGNEDCGQMSAWYVMTGMGFYSLTPASGKYALGLPLFDTLYLAREQKSPLLIYKRPHTPGDSSLHKVNNKFLTESFISHTDIMQADSLVFLTKED